MEDSFSKQLKHFEASMLAAFKAHFEEASSQLDEMIARRAKRDARIPDLERRVSELENS